MALITLRFSCIFKNGNLKKTISYNSFCRCLGTDTSNQISNVPRSAGVNDKQTGDLNGLNIKSASGHCFPNDRLKAEVNEKFKKSQVGLWTIPNALTFSRLAITPAMGYFIWNGMNSYALSCFAFAALTDLLDGFIARRFNQSSDVGALMDPVADKLLLTTCFIAMYNVDMIPLWVVKGLVFRDLVLLASGIAIRYCGLADGRNLKKFFDFKNHPTIGFEPTFLSKCNTALQCLLIVVHLSTNHLVGIPSYDWYIFALQGLTVCTTGITLGQYGVRFVASGNKFPSWRTNRLKSSTRQT